MANESKIIITTDNAKAILGLKQIEGAMSSVESKTQSIVSGLKSHWFAVSAAIAGAVVAINKAWSLAETAAAFEETNMGLQKLSAQYGMTADDIIAMSKEAIRGQLSIVEAGKLAARALQLSLNPMQVQAFLTAAADLTDVVGGSIPDAFRAMETAAAVGRKQGLVQYGIQVDLNAALEKYAKAHGIAKNEISAHTATQIRANAIILEAQKITNQMGGSVETTADKMARWKANIADLQLKVGSFLAREGVIFLDYFEKLYKIAEANKNAIYGLSVTLGTFLVLKTLASIAAITNLGWAITNLGFIIKYFSVTTLPLMVTPLGLISTAIGITAYAFLSFRDKAGEAARVLEEFKNVARGFSLEAVKAELDMIGIKLLELKQAKEAWMQKGTAYADYLKMTREERTMLPTQPPKGFLNILQQEQELIGKTKILNERIKELSALPAISAFSGVPDDAEAAATAIANLSVEWEKTTKQFERDISLLSLKDFDKQAKELEFKVADLKEKFKPLGDKVLFKIQNYFDVLFARMQADKIKEEAEKVAKVGEWLADKENKLILSETSYRRQKLIEEYNDKAKTISAKNEWTLDMTRIFQMEMTKIEAEEGGKRLSKVRELLLKRTEMAIQKELSEPAGLFDIEDYGGKIGRLQGFLEEQYRLKQEAQDMELEQLELRHEQELELLTQRKATEEEIMAVADAQAMDRELMLLNFEAVKEEERVRMVQQAEQAKQAIQQSTINNMINLLMMLGTKNKAFAIAGILLATAIEMIRAYQATLTASTLAFASQLIPGWPPSIAHAAAAAAATKAWGLVNVGLIGAIGGMRIAALSSGGGAPTGGKGLSPTTPVEIIETKRVEQARAQIININVYGSIVDHDSFARELVPSLQKAFADGVR